MLLFRGCLTLFLLVISFIGFCFGFVSVSGAFVLHFVADLGGCYTLLFLLFYCCGFVVYGWLGFVLVCWTFWGVVVVVKKVCVCGLANA